MDTWQWRRWLLLAACTVPLTLGFAALSVPSPALFAGLLVATALALPGRAPAAVPMAARDRDAARGTRPRTARPAETGDPRPVTADTVPGPPGNATGSVGGAR